MRHVVNTPVSTRNLVEVEVEACQYVHQHPARGQRPFTRLASLLPPERGENLLVSWGVVTLEFGGCVFPHPGLSVPDLRGCEFCRPLLFGRQERPRLLDTVLHQRILEDPQTALLVRRIGRPVVLHHRGNSSALGEQPIQGFEGVALHAGHDVRIDVQGAPYGRVPEHLRDRLDVGAFSERQSGEGVSEVVEAYVG